MESKQGADYDHVGHYCQDKINGLSTRLLDRMLDLADLEHANHVMDAMGGDGNLIMRVHEYCVRRQIKVPHCTLLEYSRVQTEFAKHKLPKENVEVIWGDMLGFKNLLTSECLEEGQFDRVLIKSANHEVTLEQQKVLVRNLYRLLKPGGWVVNLGFLFEDENQRDEFGLIAKTKDRLAGMKHAVTQRHFLTKKELYNILREEQFSTVFTGEKFDYEIRSDVVARQYFSGDHQLEEDLEHQMAQVKAVTLRQHGRIRFEGDASIMSLPGEVTVAKKSSAIDKSLSEGNDEFSEYLEVVNLTENVIPKVGTVVDLGCGPSFIGDRLLEKDNLYIGVDKSEQLLSLCDLKFKDNPRFKVVHGNINEFTMKENSIDVVTVLNVLHYPQAQVSSVLKNAFDMLKDGGRLVLSGPLTQEAFAKTQHGLKNYLEEHFAGLILHDVEEVISQGQSFWSQEGIVELCYRNGFKITEMKKLSSSLNTHYFVVAEKVVEDDLVRVENLFQRSLTAHLPPCQFKKLQDCTVLIGGMGSGSNVAELLARKGIGHLILADMDVYEEHNIRQRGSVTTSFGEEKVIAMERRLKEVNPHLKVTLARDGVTCENAKELVSQADVVVDLIDLHALDAKVLMHQAARDQGKYVLTAPSVINGAVLWIFDPQGMSFEEYFDYMDDQPLSELAWNHLLKAIPHFPSKELKAMYREAAEGKRTLPLDAVGVDQASVLLTAAIENIVFENFEHIVTVPQGMQVDVGNLHHPFTIVKGDLS